MTKFNDKKVENYFLVNISVFIFDNCSIFTSIPDKVFKMISFLVVSKFDWISKILESYVAINQSQRVEMIYYSFFNRDNLIYSFYELVLLVEVLYDLKWFSLILLD